jgi:hypothetical protein
MVNRYAVVIADGDSDQERLDALAAAGAASLQQKAVSTA